DRTVPDADALCQPHVSGDGGALRNQHVLVSLSQLVCHGLSSFSLISDLRGEVAVHEHWDFLSVVGNAQDVQVRRAHHEVHVGDGVVEAPGLQLVLAHGLAVLEAGIGLAEGDVAGRILVEQGVVEQDLLVGDRAVIGHQGHLAEVAGPFIHSDGGLEGLLPLFRVNLHDLPVLHHKVELVNDGAVVGQGQGGVDHAVDAGLQGRGEDLLRGDIGDIGAARQSHVVARLPDVVLRQFHSQVRAQGVGVVEGLEVQLVQLLHP
ncbi:putative membrane protein, partial [Dysosmobacter welbionis]